MAEVALVNGYPQGGVAMTSGGEGIFTDNTGEPIKIWIDYRIKASRTIIKQLQNEGAEMAYFHQEPESQILILNPGTYRLFDAYCHPDWLSAGDRRHYDRAVEKEGEGFVEEWRRKVLLKEAWVSKCLLAGRFLGEADNWGGCRVGGPPKAQAVSLFPEPIDIDADETTKRRLPDDIEIDVTMTSPPKRANIQSTAPTSTSKAMTVNQLVKSLEAPPPVQTAELAEEDDLESLHDDINQENEPHPAESSAQAAARTRYTSRPLEVSDSSDEEALASADTGSKRRRAASNRLSIPSGSRRRSGPVFPAAEEEEMGFTMLDSDPSPRFSSQPPVSAVAPPATKAPVTNGKIFDGFIFWVDLSVKNRGDLLKDIKGAGGKVASEVAGSTHVLIHKYAQQADAWRDAIATHARRGVWFLPPDWAKKCVAEKRRIPESEHVLPGGAEAAFSSSRPAAVTASVTGPSPPISTINDGLPVDQLDKIFLKEYTKRDGAVSPADLAKRLEVKYGVYKIDRWKQLFKSWEKRTDRFSHLGPISHARTLRKSDTFTPLVESPLVIKSELQVPADPTPPTFIQTTGTRLSKEELETIFARETWRFEKVYNGDNQRFANFLAAKYQAYEQATWAIYYTNWSKGRERWAGSPMMLHGQSLSLAQLREGLVFKDEATQQQRSHPSIQTGRALAMSDAAIATAFTRYLESYTAGENASERTVGQDLSRQYQEYAERTWAELYRAWKRGSMRFLQYGPRWDGQTSAVNPPVSIDQPESPVRLHSRQNLRLPTAIVATALHDYLEPYDGVPPSKRELCRAMHEKHPEYAESVWSDLYYEWRNGSHRMVQHEPRWDGHMSRAATEGSQISEMDVEARPSPAAVATTEPMLVVINQTATTTSSGSSSNARMSPAEMASIFHRYLEPFGADQPTASSAGFALTKEYPVYSNYTWENAMFSWKNGTGRFAGHPRRWDGRPDAEAGQPADPGPSSEVFPKEEVVDEVPISTPTGGRNRMSTRSIALVLHGYLSPYGDILPRDDEVAFAMAHEHPCYPKEIWQTLVADWKNASGRFTSYPRHWDGRTSFDRVPDPSYEEGHTDLVYEVERRSSSPAAPTRSLPYTEDEELAMGQFVQHQAETGQELQWKSWRTFAEVYPHRKANTWAEHYRVYKDRIGELTMRHAADNPAAPDIQEEEPVEAVERDELDDESDYDPSVKSERAATPAEASTANPRQGQKQRRKKPKIIVSKRDYEDLAQFIVDNIAEGDVPTSADFERFSQDHPERSASMWYTIWHRDRYRVTLLPLIDGLRTAAIVASQAASGSSSSRARPKPNAYSEEEEKAMARFIATSVPSDRPPKSADWTKFQKTHTKRSAPSWTEHYRVYKSRIDAMVDELRPTIASQPFGASVREAIPLESDEEEVEEVEDIVPLSSPPPARRSRPSGSGRRSDRAVIVVDDDDLDDDDVEI